MVVAMYTMPRHGAFCFEGSVLPLSVSGVPVMLHRIAFQLSGKVVALYLDNSAAKVHLCKQGGTVSPFLSRLACQILSLTNN